MVGAREVNLSPNVLEVNERTHDASVAQAFGLWVGRWLCIVAMVFASGDVWPVLKLGFTFRLAQFVIILATLIVMLMPRVRLRVIPGLKWMFGFVLWIIFTLPLSLLFQRSVAYVVWTISDFLIVATFVQYFGEPRKAEVLVRWYAVSFIAISTFGLLQLVLGLMGHSLLIRQWWIEGVLPRVNGISYEPSYYSTYLIAGWVFALRLLEGNVPVPNRRVQWLCAGSTTVALLICGSRMGWLMMLLWGGFRGFVKIAGPLSRGCVKRRWLGRLPLLILMSGLSSAAVLHYARVETAELEKVSFLLRGLDLVGDSGRSSKPREDELLWTLDAFAEHPLVGTGIGALPVDIAPHEGAAVHTVRQAKEHEGMSILPEIFASTGLVGGGLMLGLTAAVVRKYKLATTGAFTWQRELMRAVAWGLIWMLFTLQMNQNFLRIYIYVDLAVLLSCCVAYSDAAVDARSPKSLAFAKT